MNKRFMVFAYSQYYPTGGLGDVVGSFDTLAAAHECREETMGNDYVTIWDRLDDIVYYDQD